MKVMKERCNECLYSPNKIVSDARRKELLQQLEEKDDWFICHKATLAGEKVCCRGDWDARGGGQMGRIAKRLNVVRFIDEKDLTKE